MADKCCGGSPDKKKGDKSEILLAQEKSGKGCCADTDVDFPLQQSCCTIDTCGEDRSEMRQGKVAPVFEEYKVSGMDCPSCALSIEKALGKLQGVEDIHVNYSTGKLRYSAGSGADRNEVESTIEKLGYALDPVVENKNTKTYNVEGMDCGSCAKSIENHLSSINGVHHVSVHFSTGKMEVVHDNSVDEIISEVSKIGFKASIRSRHDANRPKGNNQEKGTIITSGILIALGLGGSFTGVPDLVITMLYAFSMLISGYKPVRSAYYSIRSGSLDMNVLMSAAAIGAALIGEWLEGATVVWLFALGTALQTMSIEKTRNSIRSLMNLAPTEAWIQEGSEIKKKPVEAVAIGEIMVVKPGERISLDGEIISGESSVNQAPITGESIPLDKTIGDIVYAGSINENGSLAVKVTKLVEDTTIARIIHLVEEAQDQKAPTQAFIDRFASIYTPIVFVLAVVVMVIPPLVGMGTWSEWFYRGLELLVVACPCALVISTPVAIVSAIGSAAKYGVLIKGGTFLEKAAGINAIAFDKTGTLTEGKPNVSGIKVFEGTEEELLSIAMTLEGHSTHPIARTIVKHASERGISGREGSSFTNITGKGVKAIIGGTQYIAGSVRLFRELNGLTEEAETVANTFENEGKTVVIIGHEDDVLGILAVADTIRRDTVETISSLKEAGINQVVMLTGDNPKTAQLVSREAGIDRSYAELLPEDKVNVIKQLQREGYHVAMVGDGINDAPALATADLGIAMGGAGTDTAMETADIVLMADNLDKLPHTINLSQRALSIIKQNIWFSLVVKFVALALIFPGWLTLWLAVLSDTGAAIIVILNALRLVKGRSK
ncbi:cadmium-translocating P-type ATPase (plasmid) [Rossellomorea marisflavi]|uniref:heavy metal translocating P-type ATPase n=1 Tax=Rossellomorea marisflavi TaxID=189381 RepID=UPI0013170480|nr:heavy metal translocating P-type ATPase [Rossellomorea marisflavi]QHA38671.1 cadmium-translocating P-type ATPase [Rossellomorea marisflavi]